MSALDDSLPAFPAIGAAGPDYIGMTLRDYFAAKAMASIISLNDIAYENMRHVAEDAYRYADRMLEARKK